MRSLPELIILRRNVSVLMIITEMQNKVHGIIEPIILPNARTNDLCFNGEWYDNNLVFPRLTIFERTPDGKSVTLYSTAFSTSRVSDAAHGAPKCAAIMHLFSGFSLKIIRSYQTTARNSNRLGDYTTSYSTNSNFYTDLA
jgi:hypothetical protein